MSGKFCIALGGFYGFLAVALGAVGAHALRAHASDEVMALYRTANSYHFYHALALVAVGLLAQSRASIWLKLAGLCFALGALLFCGSLYLLALAGLHATLAPFGGTLLMLGWLMLAFAALKGPTP